MFAEPVDPIIFARRITQLMVRIVERRKKFADDERADFAEVERVFGQSVGRAIITMLLEERAICPKCSRDVPQSEIVHDLCAHCDCEQRDAAALGD